MDTQVVCALLRKTATECQLQSANHFHARRMMDKLIIYDRGHMEIGFG